MNPSINKSHNKSHNSPSQFPDNPLRHKRKKHVIILFIILGIIIIFFIGFLFLRHKLRNYVKRVGEEKTLHLAVEAADIEEVERLILQGADVNETWLAGHTPLIIATDSNHGIIAELLLKAGANPNQKDDIGWAALHHAIRIDKAELDLINILVQYGADVNIQDHHLRTPLHRAAQFGHVEALILLIELGANPQAKDYRELTPFDRGAAHPEIQEVLSKYY